MMNEKILVINPGSTSTKIAVFEEKKELWKENIQHSLDELANYPTVFDQLDMRKKLIMDKLASHNEDISNLSAVVSRGGCMPPVHAGAYQVTDHMVDDLHYHAIDQHASNVGAAIALDIANQAGINAYIYDALTIDEMTELNKITGLKGVRHEARGHNLNTRAAALRYCSDNNVDYQKATIVVAHLGGGITINLQKNGHIEDIVMDEEGAFSPERAGGLPTYSMVKLCYSGKYTQEEMMKNLQRKGGMISYFGTSDMIDIENRITKGDYEADIMYKAMAMSVGKNIAKISAGVYGKVDQIVLTGGLANSKMLVEMITKYAEWIAPVTVYPGEKEMAALAEGTLRVLRGEEKADIY